MKPCILATTPHEGFRGHLEICNPAIESCYHFDGLYRTSDNRRNEDLDYYSDVARLAKIVRDKNALVVVLGAHGPVVYRGTLDAALFLLKHTPAQSVIAMQTKALYSVGVNDSVLEVHLYEINSNGLQLLRAQHAHSGTEFIPCISQTAQGVFDNLILLKKSCLNQRGRSNGPTPLLVSLF